MTVLDGRERLHRPDLARLQPQLGRRAHTGGFRVDIPPTPPHHQDAADHQQRGCVLHDHLEWPERPRRDEIERLDSVWPGFGARLDRAGVLHAAFADRAREELALAPGALDKRHGGTGKGDGERQTRKAGAASEVGQGVGGPDRRELERDEGIGKVVVDHLERITHGRGREWIFDQEAVESLEARRRFPG